MTRLMLAVVVALGAGLIAGYVAAPDVGAAATIAAPADPGGTVAEPVGHLAMLRPADVELLKRELASAIASSTPAASPQVEPRTATPPSETVETIAANESLRDVLDGAVANGVWTNEDAAVMNALMRRASPDAVHNAFRTLAVAINNEQLRLEAERLTF